MKINIPETAIHVSYLPWLARVDALIGEPARLDLARHTSFLAAWREGLSPHEAVADAKSRSMPHMTKRGELPVDVMGSGTVGAFIRCPMHIAARFEWIRGAGSRPVWSCLAR
jgi:hypothetical protein